MNSQTTSLPTTKDTQSTLVKFQCTDVCDKCGQPIKTAQIMIFGALKSYRCMCSCEVEEDKRRKLEEQQRERKQRLESLFKQSKLGERFRNASFDKFVVSNKTQIVFNAMKDYAENFREKYKSTSILLFSNPGTGKTLLTSAVINHLVKNSISAIFCVVPDLMVQIRSTFNDISTTEAQLLRGLTECELLALDDIGAERHRGSEDWATEKLYQIVNARYNDNKATIFTTNCSMDSLYNKLGSRTFSRIIEMSDGWRYDLNNIKDWRLRKLI